MEKFNVEKVKSLVDSRLTLLSVLLIVLAGAVGGLFTVMLYGFVVYLIVTEYQKVKAYGKKNGRVLYLCGILLFVGVFFG